MKLPGKCEGDEAGFWREHVFMEIWFQQNLEWILCLFLSIYFKLDFISQHLIH